jgi:hypothetical protein
MVVHYFFLLPMLAPLPQTGLQVVPYHLGEAKEKPVNFLAG